MSNIKIVSDGHGNNTRVINLDTGTEIKGITAITVEILPDNFVNATLEFTDVELEINAEID